MPVKKEASKNLGLEASSNASATKNSRRDLSTMPASTAAPALLYPLNGTSSNSSSCQLSPRSIPKKRHISQTELDALQQKINEEESLYRGLCMDRETTVNLLNAIRSGQVEEGLTYIRACFHFTPPIDPLITESKYIKPTEPYKYNPEKEDANFRDTVMAQYFFDAMTEGFRLAFTPLQCAYWMNLFKKCHDEFIDSKSGEPAVAASIFKKNLIEMLKYNEFHSSSVRSSTTKSVSVRSPKPIFTSQDGKHMIDYFLNSYVKHSRLISHMLTKHRALEITVLDKTLEQDVTFEPLSKGIPAEKWEEYLAAEAEALQRKKEAELEAIENAKRELIERERAREEEILAAERARLKALSMIINISPIEPFNAKLPDPPSADSILPVDPETKSIDPKILLLPTEPISPIKPDGLSPNGKRASVVSKDISHPKTAEMIPSKAMMPQLIFHEHADDLPILSAIPPTVISTALNATVSGYIEKMQTHIDQHLEYQSRELMARIEKLAVDRSTIKQREIEEANAVAAVPKTAAPIASTANLKSNATKKK